MCRQNTLLHETCVYVQRVTERTAQMFSLTQHAWLKIAHCSASKSCLSSQRHVSSVAALATEHIHTISLTNVTFRPFSPSLSCPTSTHSGLEYEILRDDGVADILNLHLPHHPNRETLIEDLDKTEEFNPFSEKSKELITRVVTRSTSSCVRSLPKYKSQIVLYIGKLALFTAPAANACSRRNEFDS